MTTNKTHHVDINNDSLPNNLLETKELVYDKCGYEFANLLMENESKEYAAYAFELNNLAIRFRVAKITPTKTGQFVTLWKRIGNGPIQPFAVSDEIDLFVINTRMNNNFGQFIFPKSVLLEKGVISSSHKEGKRAIRVYPPWDNATNNQAKKTQKWQLEYFLPIPHDQPIDIKRAKALYSQSASFKV